MVGTPDRRSSARPRVADGDAFMDLARLIKANVGLQVSAADYGYRDMHAGIGTLDDG
jgi:hypothetical protein